MVRLRKKSSTARTGMTILRALNITAPGNSPATA